MTACVGHKDSYTPAELWPWDSETCVCDPHRAGPDPTLGVQVAVEVKPIDKNGWSGPDIEAFALVVCESLDPAVATWADKVVFSSFP